MNEQFFNGYVHAALWSSLTSAGVPLDRDFTFEDIEPESLAKMRADCESFWDKAYALGLGLPVGPPETGLYPSASSIVDRAEMAGADFWLTRNGHGSGFWDGDWEEPVATVLTELAKTFGEQYLENVDGALVVS